MLSSGTKLGPYEITSPIGAGGMGEVYKARDTRLDRTVAIKILPEHLADSPERHERFEREARAVSALDHPHICRLCDIRLRQGPGGQAGYDVDVDFIVMEHLEGETLAERLKKGPLRFEDALRYGREIADALDKAHREGVVHRDLKPGNIMLTKSGAVLLDFGLAKRTGLAGRVSDGSDSAQPTPAKDLTDEGTVLGTFQYMAPEQLEGREIDGRTDIFAFGAVLYEMVTGKKAFTSSSRASLIGAILKDDPPSIASLQPTSPPELERVLRKCLEKDPDQRWGSAHDVAELLSWVTESKTEASSHRQTSRTMWMVAAIAGWAVAIGASILGGAGSNNTLSSVRFSIDTSKTPALIGTGRLAVSPDGQTVVFSPSSDVGVPDTSPGLYARDLASLELRALAGTDGASRVTFSPDGEWLAFHSRIDRKLKRVRLDGGAPQVIVDVTATNVRGLSSAS